MNIFPAKKQWKSWTLPSKASYIGVVLSLVLFAIGFLINEYSSIYVRESDQPKLVIRTQNKPYLRYKVVSNNGIEFSYELSFNNSGKNSAINIKYSYVRQKLVIGDKTIVQVNYTSDSDNLPSKAGYIAPTKLISGDKFFQIFQLKGNGLRIDQIKSLINDYEHGQLSVIIDIGIEYDDAITLKKYNSTEILKIYKNMDSILNKT